ncbi:MAG: SDR family oxidoreductase [Pseudomonadota bacterium]
MTASSSPQVAIVTGASRGIGAAVAQRLAKDGYSVVVNYAGKQADAQAVVQAIESAGGKAIAVQADVADPAAARKLFDEAIKAWGRVDVLVNNAGIMPPSLPQIGATDDATFDRVFAINVKGTFNTLREAANRLEADGRIVNFSTSVIGRGMPGYGVYAATKAAVENLTNVMAQEMRGKRITVNSIAPGPTATALFLDGKPPELVERLSKVPPLERLGTPADIAAAVAFLVGSDGAWINGQTLRANGGFV